MPLANKRKCCPEPMCSVGIPDGITGFHGQPGEVIPRYAGKRYEWRIGETTDDTEQTLAVARALLREGRASHKAIGRELLQCKNPSIQACHCGPSCSLVIHLGSHQMAMAAERPCARRRSACLSIEQAGRADPGGL